MNWEPWTGCYPFSDGCKYCYFYGIMPNDRSKIPYRKVKLEVRWVNKHRERIKKIRAHMDRRRDARKIFRAMVAGCASDREREYAEEQELFVLVQNADDFDRAEQPNSGFNPRIW